MRKRFFLNPSLQKVASSTFLKRLESYENKCSSFEQILQLLNDGHVHDRKIYKVSFKPDTLRYFLLKSSYSLDNGLVYEFFYVYESVRRDKVKEYTEKLTKKSAALAIYNTQIPESVIEQIKFEALKEVPAEPVKKELTPNLVELLGLYNFNYDINFYEGRHWVEKYSSPYFLENWWRLKELLIHIAEKLVTADTSPITNTPIILKVAKRDHLRIIYSSETYEGKEIVFLHSYCSEESLDETLSTLKNDYSSFFTKNEVPSISEFVKRYSRRVYQDYVLYDDAAEKAKHAWARIQEETDSNISLSSQEKDVLEKANFPFFINGAAGSGKSTILQFLLAQYLYSIKKHNLDHKIVFLSYSEALCQTTRERVFNILTKNPSYTDTKFEFSELAENVVPFIQFLQDILKQHTSNSLFRNDAYRVDFVLFKSLYSGINPPNRFSNYIFSNHSIRKKYSTELVWHFIRAIIKGNQADNVLSNDDYELLPERSILKYDEYKEIFEHVWKSWYRTLDGKLWDDQDLVLQVLNLLNSAQQINEPKYGIILCDEAQDYTKNEIKLILRLSSYYGYNLSNHKKFPLAFAGDPFQTVNPSGFSLNRLRDLFFESFNESGFNSFLQNEVLTINFRSSRDIVLFSNTVQFLRSMIFEDDITDPQEAFNHEGRKPLLFVLNETIFAQDLIDARNTTIIIPEDNKKLFFEKFPEVGVFKSDDENLIFRNIETVFDIKGCEKDRIIIYNFGEYGRKHLGSSFQGELQQSESMEAKYFFNKLYVAITRARKKLVIIDTIEGKTEFWEKFINWIKGERDSGAIEEKWLDNISLEPIEYGAKENLIELKVEDPFESAEFYYNNGEAQRNEQFLFKAAEFYKEADKLINSYISSAKAYEILRLYNEAADFYDKAGKFTDAAEFYWRSKNWDKFIETTGKIKVPPEKAFRNDLAAFLNKGLTNFSSLSHINFKDFNSSDLDVFDSCISEFLSRAKSVKILTQNHIDVNLIDLLIKISRESFFRDRIDEILETLFQFNDFTSVLTIADNSNKTDSNWYKVARAETTNDSKERIKLLSDIPGKESRVLSEWNANFETLKSDITVYEIVRSKLINSSQFSIVLNQDLFWGKFTEAANLILTSSFEEKFSADSVRSLLKGLLRDENQKYPLEKIYELWQCVYFGSESQSLFSRMFLRSFIEYSPDPNKALEYAFEFIDTRYYTNLSLIKKYNRDGRSDAINAPLSRIKDYLKYSQKYENGLDNGQNVSANILKEINSIDSERRSYYDDLVNVLEDNHNLLRPHITPKSYWELYSYLVLSLYELRFDLTNLTSDNKSEIASFIRFNLLGMGKDRNGRLRIDFEGKNILSIILKIYVSVKPFDYSDICLHLISKGHKLLDKKMDEYLKYSYHKKAPDYLENRIKEISSRLNNPRHSGVENQQLINDLDTFKSEKNSLEFKRKLWGINQEDLNDHDIFKLPGLQPIMEVVSSEDTVDLVSVEFNNEYKVSLDPKLELFIINRPQNFCIKILNNETHSQFKYDFVSGENKDIDEKIVQNGNSFSSQNSGYRLTIGEERVVTIWHKDQTYRYILMAE